LLELARTGQSLEETFSYPIWKIARLWGLFLFAALGGFILTPFIGAYFAGELTLAEAAKYWAIGMVFLPPFVAVFTAAATAGCALNRPTIRVDAGELTVTQRKETDRVPLSQCEWYVGKVSHNTILEKATIIQAPCVIVVLPPTDEKEPGSKVAVGITEAEREIWDAFLRLTGVPQRTDWGFKSRVPTIFKYLAWFVIIPAGFFGFVLIGAGVAWLLSLFIADRGLCQIVGTLVFVLGLLSAVAYASILGPWHSTRRVPSKRTPEEQRKQMQVMFLKQALVMTVMIVLPILTMQHSALAKVVGIALTYAWVAVMSFHYGRLITAFDREFARPSAGRPAADGPRPDDAD
jgi:hypothetical protein